VYISDFFMSVILCWCIVTFVILAYACVCCVYCYSVAVSHAAGVRYKLKMTTTTTMINQSINQA